MVRKIPTFVRRSHAHRVTAALLLACLAPVAVASKFTREAADDRVALIVTSDAAANLDGGLQTNERFLYNVDLLTRIEFESGDSLYVHGSYNNGETFSPDVAGDIQVASNIEADEATRLYQIYYERGSEDDDSGFLVGLWDLNSRLDVIPPAGVFINSSHGIGAEYALSGEFGPSIFPVTSLALYGHYRPHEGVWLRGAVLDGVPGDPDKPHRTRIELSKDDGALLAGEAEWAMSSNWTAKAGLWHYTSQFERVDNEQRDDFSTGAYASVYGDFLPGRLSGWLRYGFANDAVQQVGRYFGAGLVLQEIPGGLDDRFGIALASAVAGDPLRDSGASRAETSVELTYSAQLTPWLRLQPDLQYIVNPGLDPDRDDALVLMLRMEVSVDLRF